MEDFSEKPDSASPSSREANQQDRFRPVGWILMFLGAVIVVVGGYYLAMRFAITNFHVLVPGKVYRSAQPSPEQLERWCRRYDLKTIVNLRADAEKTGLDDERSAALRAGALVINLRFSDRRLPEKNELMQLIDVLENSPRPILLHCKAGADRAGMASVLAAMAVGGKTYCSASTELTAAYLHVDNRPTSIGGIFNLFEDHCRKNSISVPTWPDFKKWAIENYQSSVSTSVE